MYNLFYSEEVFDRDYRANRSPQLVYLPAVGYLSKENECGRSTILGHSCCCICYERRPCEFPSSFTYRIETLHMMTKLWLNDQLSASVMIHHYRSGATCLFFTHKIYDSNNCPWQCIKAWLKERLRWFWLVLVGLLWESINSVHQPTVEILPIIWITW